ncbi:MAG: FeoA domain-containing protein [Candidatus Omnitrophota bacterium]
MKEELIPLLKIPEGQEVTLAGVEGGQGVRKRLTDMGLNQGVRFKVLHSHGRGACVIRVHNTRLMLGHGMANRIMVKEV